MSGTTDWIAAAAGGRIDGALREQLERLLKEPTAAGLWGPFVRTAKLWRHGKTRLPILLDIDADLSRSEFDSLCEQLSRLGCRTVRRFRAGGVLATEASPETIRRVLEQTDVPRLLLDRPVRTCLDVAAPTVGAPTWWAKGRDGRGVTVAVLDTGIFPHADFLNPLRRLKLFHDVIKQRSSFYDDNGHGTHVAGIIAGNGARSAGRYKGIAPAAELVAVKVLNEYGTGRLSQILAGLDWVLEEHRRLDIRVLNISLGSPTTLPPSADPLARAAARLWREGIVICAAAGNMGPEAQTIASPGDEPTIITVGAADDRGSIERGDDTTASFSSRGPTLTNDRKPDVLAPGVAITAPLAPGSTLAGDRGLRSAPYVALSGTSMATGVASGVAALVLAEQPDLTPDQIKNLLMHTATKLGSDVHAEGCGLIQLEQPRSLYKWRWPNWLATAEA